MAGFWGRYLEGMCAMSEGSLVPDVVGLPWDLAKGLLNEAHIMYNSVITYPTKSFFPLMGIMSSGRSGLVMVFWRLHWQLGC